jgi:drug/metabolite transporter (DMT)-like permease
MRGPILNLSAWLILPIMDAIAKYLSYSLPILQITWFRFFFSAVITGIFIYLFSRKSFVRSKNIKSQVLRGILLLTSSLLFFYAISVISLAKALTLAFICPLIVTALSPYFLKERVGRRRWTAVIVGFIGVLLVIRPGIVEFNWASLASLGTGLCYAIYLIVTRSLKDTDNGLLTLLFTSIVGTVVLSVYLPFVWVNPSLNQLLLAVNMGFIAALAHGLIIISYNYSDASKLAPLGYFEIIPNIIIGYIWFSDFPDKYTVLGLLVIILSGIYVFRREQIIKYYK